MPEQLSAEMEAAAGLVPELELLSLKLASIEGYLGRFEVMVELQQQRQNLAKLSLGAEYFDLVVDLGAQPYLAVALKPAGYRVVSDQDDIEQQLEQALALKGGFEKPRYIQVNNELCALTANTLDGCRRCLDVCPADAISVIAQQVNIDAHLCHGAGGCASACPTSAIRYGFPQPVLLMDTLQRLLDGYRQAGGVAPLLLLHDAESNALVEQLLPQLPGHYLPLQLEELASAGIELWLSAIAAGCAGVRLLDEGVQPASIAAVLETELSVANQLLRGLQLPVSIERLTQSQLLSQADEIELPQLTPVARLHSGADKRQQLSTAMTHLYQQQSATNALPEQLAVTKGAPYGSVLIDSAACTLCNACSATCPTGALTSGGDSPCLSFTEDACVQCGLCTQACPEQALSLQPRYLLDPRRRTEPRVLKQEEPFRCISCGDAFATQSVVAMMVEKLAGHSMFDEQGLRRLKMCADCRVIDMVKSNPEGDLFDYAKGRPAESGELQLTVVENSTAVNNKAVTQEVNG
jgi:ferredoxin